MLKLIDDVKKVYSHIEGDISKYIFTNRLMFSLTDNECYIRDIVKAIPDEYEIFKKMESNNCPIGIFGAGIVGSALVKTYDNLPIKCFIDNKKSGSLYEGKPVVTLDSYQKLYPDGMIIVSTKFYYHEIIEQLLNVGIASDKIINLGQAYCLLTSKQYFDLPAFNMCRKSREVFVDGGAYDGETTTAFFHWAGKTQEAFSYMWEPDDINCKKIEEKIAKTYVYKGGVKLVNCGLWDKKEKLRFFPNGKASTIDDNGVLSINADSIDNACNDDVSFIKMDVEGAEEKALMGAKKTIIKNKPKLAICVYHKPEDIVEIPKLILSFRDDYTFEFRHYSYADNETVLYAY